MGTNIVMLEIVGNTKSQTWHGIIIIITIIIIIIIVVVVVIIAGNPLKNHCSNSIILG
jgi:heme/copper-type cytochrome/quinol oxidase subunit 2